MPAHRRFTHPRSPWRTRLERWTRPLQRQGGLLLLVLSIAGSTVLLYTLPVVWVGRRLAQLTAGFQDSHWQQFQDVYRHWVRYDPPPAFHRGDEPAVASWLRDRPLVAAVVARDGAVWLRGADRLAPAGPDPEAERLRTWVEQARRGGQLLFPPPPALNPEHLRAPALVLVGESFSLVKRWTVGSEAVETALQRIQQGRRPLKVGLRRIDPAQRGSGPPGDWSRPPHLQADFPQGERSPWELVGNDESFGEGWELAALPGEEDQALLQATITRESRLAWTAYCVLAVAFAGGLFLRHRARQRERLDSDRLAAMAHSLKTPLAVLKLRCDSLRMGGLPADKADAQLLRIGEEVESLVHIIENSLQLLRRAPAPSPRSPVEAAFYQGVREDLVEAFAAEDRDLRLLHDGTAHAANLPALRSALVTLLENALLHGAGATELRVARAGRFLRVAVRDQGAGLDPAQLQALGRPFMRFRREGGQGFLHEGQGLGMSLLVQSAQREGWGLEVSTAPGAGLEAVLTLPL